MTTLFEPAWRVELLDKRFQDSTHRRVFRNYYD